MSMPTDQQRAIKRTGLMFGAGVLSITVLTIFVIPPFYDWFCRVTGFAGTPLQTTENTSEVLDETINIRFDASLSSDMPWEFTPVENMVEIRIGQDGLAFYEAYNPTDRTIVGTATFNVTPEAAGGFFVKVDCFCFTEQVLRPGERVEMPVSYFVDPAIMDDPEGRRVPTITLSYTFFEKEMSEEETAALTRTDSDATETN